MTRIRTIVLGGVAVAVLAGCTTGSTPKPSQFSYGAGLALPKASCGSASTNGTGSASIAFASPGALGCFHAAAQACQSASIEVANIFVDTGTLTVLRIEPSGGKTCRATELSQSLLPGAMYGPLQTSACDRITVTLEGVTLDCGAQPVFIPAVLGRKDSPYL